MRKSARSGRDGCLLRRCQYLPPGARSGPPKENQKNTGFLPEERAWIDRVVEAGYVDTFRHFYPDLPDQYTWWSMPTQARERNIGWRLDYFFIAREALDRLVDAFILPGVAGSDHCPVGIRLRV